MNYRTLVKGALALSLSLTVGMASAADVQEYGATFEGTAVAKQNDFPYTLNSGITNAAYRTSDNDGAYGWFAGADDESKIIARVAEGSTQALQLNTDAGTLTNKFQKTVADTLNTAIAADGAYFETEVKFVPSDTNDAGITGGQDATKFAIYAYANEEADPPVTNLVVYHAYYDGATLKYTNEVFETTPINCEVYTKLRIEMKQTESLGGATLNVFSVKVGDGNALTSDLAFEDGIWFITVEESLDDDNKLVSSLNFKGTGEIDNIKAGVIENYVPDSNWTIEGFNPRNEWTDPTAVAADSKTLFYSNLVVNIDPTDAAEGRNIVAAWVGTKVIASEAAVETIANWKFDYDSQNGTRQTNKSFVSSKDGEWFLYWWVPITAAEVRTAIATQSDIVKTMAVYADGDSANAQTLTVSICPKNIQITNTDDVENGETIEVINWVEQSAQQTKPAWANDSGDGSQSDPYWAWATAHAAGQTLDAAGADFSAQYLMNIDADKTPVLKIDSIVVTDEGSQIVVSATDGTTAINLAQINGVLNVLVGTEVGSLTKKAIPAANVRFADNVATIIIPAADGKFIKASVDYAAGATSLTAVAAGE